ncbi:PREDICTED: uncharacterized protein LOC102821270 [Chrysochloris asiatica]|uniref:Uncharacterized protein LOC102821270 n=1 Tax=Chrysochloris asiatica TaxID=185453 RepID=A0A9B0TGP7_CHRAS|nr:PREDICTED: uncharacterized protein LOC102821270 [Chrysochloris asiatica]
MSTSNVGSPLLSHGGAIQAEVLAIVALKGQWEGDVQLRHIRTETAGNRRAGPIKVNVNTPGVFCALALVSACKPPASADSCSDRKSQGRRQARPTESGFCHTLLPGTSANVPLYLCLRNKQLLSQIWNLSFAHIGVKDHKVGAALPLDVLTYEEKTLSAILRIGSSGLVKLWSSLTLLGSYQGKKCAFRVIQVSPFLLALSGNSRELVLD